MAIDNELLEMLVCPVCRKPLVYREKKGKEQLQCTGCRRVYPIEDNIPVLLPDAGVLENEK